MSGSKDHEHDSSQRNSNRHTLSIACTGDMLSAQPILLQLLDRQVSPSKQTHQDGFLPSELHATMATSSAVNSQL
jgi:hypothetical protein